MLGPTGSDNHAWANGQQRLGRHLAPELAALTHSLVRRIENVLDETVQIRKGESREKFSMMIRHVRQLGAHYYVCTLLHFSQITHYNYVASFLCNPTGERTAPLFGNYGEKSNV
jgi:hypothetical protein